MKSYQKHYFDATQIVRANTKVIVQDAMNAANSRGTPKFNRVSPVATMEMKKFQNGDSKIADQFYAETQAQQQLQHPEALYQMFSHLLDTKVEEIRSLIQEGKGLKKIMPKNDIEDDYMGIMHPSNHDTNNNNNNLRVNNTSIYRRSMSNPNVSKGFP